MDPVCRAALCNEPAERLPDEMAFLDIHLCGGHQKRLRAAGEGIENRDWWRSALMVEARRLLYPTGDFAVLSVLQGGVE